MAWIRLPKPKLEDILPIRQGLPAVYGAPPSARLPEAVRRESIVATHAMAPAAMVGIFGGFNALLSPSLPLSRREQEMIAVVVSSINDCFY
jgi:hypothetical protein